MQKVNRDITRVTLVNSATNTLLALFKIAVGVIGHSQALVADGIHSFSDLVSDAFVYFAARLGHREADHDHPYGHRRIETLGAVVIALLLVLVGAWLVYDNLHRVVTVTPTLADNGWVALVAFVSVLANEGLYRYTLKIGNKINSNLLRNNAWHNRSDAMVSLIVLASLVGRYFHWHYLDTVAALIIAALILKMGVKMLRSGIAELIDTGVDEAILEKIKQAIFSVPGVMDIHMLRTRSLGGNVFVDVHIIVNPKISVSEGHHISDEVHQALKSNIKYVTDVTVHIDPEDDEKYMPSLGLPNRQQLLSSLKMAWQALPGYGEIKNVELHYLDGQLEIDVMLPIQYRENTLEQRYQEAVGGLPVRTVKLYYR